MVLSILFEQLFPSHRGLIRNHEQLAAGDSALIWEQEIESGHYIDLAEESSVIGTSHLNNSISDSRQPKPLTLSATRPKRKRFKASKCLASVASDLDVVTDWLYYGQCRGPIQMKLAEDGKALIPSYALDMVLVSCIMGTILWFVLATDGACARPLLKTMGYDKLSLGHVLFFCVLVEDIPQIILTFLVENYFAGGGDFNVYALVSVIVSLYDAFIKLAEAFDERGDIVETGKWCKESIHAHPNQSVTCVLHIPEIPESGKPATESTKQKRRKSIIEEVKTVVDDAKLPLTRFISASDDGTVKLWDTNSNHPKRSSDTDTRTFWGHEGSRVSCLAYLGRYSTHPECFLTGSYDGTVKLWTTEEGFCLKSYHTMPVANELERLEVTDIATLSMGRRKTRGRYPMSATAMNTPDEYQHFLTSHKSGKARLWALNSDACLKIFQETEIPNSSLLRAFSNDYKSRKLRSICSMENAMQFATGSEDYVIRLWNVGHVRETSTVYGIGDMSINNINNSNGDASSNIEIVTQPDQWFRGHSGAVTSLECLSPGKVLLSGSKDKTARLWNIANGACLRTLDDHSSGVTSLAIVDPLTVLTASEDKSVKVWDALSGTCIRTYEKEHTEGVTSVSITENTRNSAAFCSASKDGTVKLWVLSAIPHHGSLNGGPLGATLSQDEDNDGTLRELLTVENGELVCNMICCPGEESVDETNDIKAEIS